MATTVFYRVADGETGPSVNSYNLSDGTYCKIISLQGIGIPENDWVIDQSPDGMASRIHSLVLKPRNMVLRAIWEETTESLATARRENLYKIFKPFDPGWENMVAATNEVRAYLRLTRPDASVRDIECYTNGPVDIPISLDAIESSKLAGRFTVNLIAPDPTWFDPTTETETDITMSGSGSGSFTADVEDSTWFMYPIFTIAGPFTTLRIYNAAFGSEFTLNSVPDATTITVDTRPNVKDGLRIYDTGGSDKGDLIDDVTEGFARFYLPPQWFNNGLTTDTISYSYTGGDAGSSLTMTWNKRFIGA